MKKYLLIPLTAILCLSFISGDTPNAVSKAKQLTDQQIDSIYKGRVDPVTDAIHNNFRELRQFIDSLNVETVLAIQRADSASMQRDSVQAVLLNLIADNTRLKEENKAYERDFRIISYGPTIIMLLVCVFVATLISHGVYEAIKQNRK